MPKYSVKTTVDFYGEVEADTPEEAEEKGWDWEDLMYDGVFEIIVEEIEEDEEENA